MANQKLNTSYHCLYQHYEDCFHKHGPNARGVDWPNEADALTRHRVMMDLWRDDQRPNLHIVDVGCGYGAFYEYLQQRNSQLNYTGIDLSAPMLKHAAAHNPTGTFVLQDILTQPLEKNRFDYGVMNGVFTEKLTMAYAEMESFAQAMIMNLYRSCRYGIAFNIMNTHLDWTRLDLFHMPFDRLAAFLKAQCSRHFTFRADYGLYEYTVYLYKR